MTWLNDFRISKKGQPTSAMPPTKSGGPGIASAQRSRSGAVLGPTSLALRGGGKGEGALDKCYCCSDAFTVLNEPEPDNGSFVLELFEALVTSYSSPGRSRWRTCPVGVCVLRLRMPA